MTEAQGAQVIDLLTQLVNALQGVRTLLDGAAYLQNVALQVGIVALAVVAAVWSARFIVKGRG